MKSDRKIRKKSVKNKSDQPRDIKQKIGHEHVGQNKSGKNGTKESDKENRTCRSRTKKSDTENRIIIGDEIGQKNRKKVGQEQVGQKNRAKIGHEIGQKIGHINRHE